LQYPRLWIWGFQTHCFSPPLAQSQLYQDWEDFTIVWWSDSMEQFTCEYTESWQHMIDEQHVIRSITFISLWSTLRLHRNTEFPRWLSLLCVLNGACAQLHCLS
jgi:hypothetical protein